MTTARVRKFSSGDDHDLRYVEMGSGRPLVLFHGFTASASQWRDHGPAAALAAQGRRVILPDLRGHGDSAHPHDPAFYPPDVLADDGLALIDRLGLEDYDLGGYSLGARVVLRMLVRGARPARAIVAGQGLSAVSSGPGGGLYRRVLTALADGDPLRPGSPDAEAAHWIGHIGGDPRALLLVLDSLVGTDNQALSGIETETLVLVGDHDDGQASADQLAGVLPNSRFALVRGDHWAALGGSDLANEITEFLDDGSGGGLQREAG